MILILTLFFFPFLDGDVPRTTSYGVYISQLIRFARVSSHMADFKARDKRLTAKLLQQGFGIINFGKLFLNCIVDTLNWFLNIIPDSGHFCNKACWHHEYYGDLVYTFRKIVGKTEFFDEFKKLSMRYQPKGYNVDVMRLSACSVVNPITVNKFAVPFNCTPVGWASDSMIAPT